jgi:quercetin dioxygenase-like cupin family protein
MALQLGDQVITGTSGQLVRIPAGTPHAFAVTTETARPRVFDVQFLRSKMPLAHV